VEVKKLFLSLVIIIGVTLLAIGLFFGNVEFTSADDKIDKIKDKDYINSLRVNDSIKVIGDLTKEYIADDKELKINDKKGLLVDLKLLTPYENKVSSSGIEPIAKWQAIDWSDKWKLFDKIDSYKINDDYKVKDKNYVLKYLVETEKTNCYDESQINNETLENETKEVCYDYIQKDWIKFNKAKDLPHKDITIGLFASNLIEGEHNEVLYTIEGIGVYEWASYLVTDLISSWELEETSGTTAYDELGTNNGTNNGATINQSGKIGKCYDFESTDTDYIEFVDSSDWDDFFQNNFSVSVWIKAETITGSMGVFGKWYDGTRVWSLGTGSAGGGTTSRIGIRYDKSRSTGQFESANTAISAGTWYHIITTKSSAGMKIYIDGDEKASTTDNPTTTNNANVSIGNTQYNGNYAYYPFDGLIDEVIVWSRVLNSTEISYLYASGSPGELQQYPFSTPTVYCNFSGYAFDQDDTALVGANVTVWNQFNVSEYYQNTTIADGKWSVQVPNSTNTYMAGAYYNNTLIGQLKQGISGTC